LKKFRLSLLYVVLLLATSPFHLPLRNLLLRAQGFHFASYVLLAIMGAFFLLAFFKALVAGKALELAAILLAAVIVLYFLFQRRIFLNQAFFGNFLHIAEFFILGLLLFRENKRTSSIAPFAILIAAAFAFELVQFFLRNRVVDANDIWTNAIAGLAGMVVGYF
jgi:glycopeptide antibiotics resistance protein